MTSSQAARRGNHECSVKHVPEAMMHPFGQFGLSPFPRLWGKEYFHLPSDLSSGGDHPVQRQDIQHQLAEWMIVILPANVWLQGHPAVCE